MRQHDTHQERRHVLTGVVSLSLSYAVPFQYSGLTCVGRGSQGAQCCDSSATNSSQNLARHPQHPGILPPSAQPMNAAAHRDGFSAVWQQLSIAFSVSAAVWFSPLGQSMPIKVITLSYASVGQRPVRSMSAVYDGRVCSVLRASSESNMRSRSNFSR